MQNRFRLVAAAALAATLIISHGAPARAQNFSDRPIKMIVGVAAGGATDVTARVIAQKLSESLKTPVIVENKPGGFFEPAYRELTSAAPDGHTVFMISAAIVVAQPARKNYPFDIRKMTPISEVSSGPFILTARKSLNVKSIGDLVAYGKANPGKLTFGSGGGAGSSLSLCAELFRLKAGLKIVNVPYKGAANALTDLMGNSIDAMFDALPVEVGQVKSGNVVGLAVTGAKRSPALPNVPTMMEAGIKDYETYNYFGLIAPPNTPKPIAKALSDATAKAVASPEIKALFEKQGMAPVGNDPDAFGKALAEDLQRWTDVIKDAGITPQ
ncbi:MAG TPA: tripartite tricarboxylate transporter substrate binding protein [Pseudolabrys sp.]|jgi:tripartite-type tricarboxylate transporter receptor subunit TctC|nr:tripartite tricarboxylate transporter substrate binding protein [Pseudolabrys sp.]